MLINPCLIRHSTTLMRLSPYRCLSTGQSQWPLRTELLWIKGRICNKMPLLIPISYILHCRRLKRGYIQLSTAVGSSHKSIDTTTHSYRHQLASSLVVMLKSHTLIGIFTMKAEQNLQGVNQNWKKVGSLMHLLDPQQVRCCIGLRTRSYTQEKTKHLLG